MGNLVLCPLAASLVLVSAAVAYGSEGCSNKTLQGTYIFSAAGNDKTPIAFAGMLVYDGAGNALFKGKQANNAEISLKGTYTVEKNCRGEIRYEDGRTLTYFIAPSGDELSWVITSGPVVASSSRRVSKKDLIGMKP